MVGHWLIEQRWERMLFAHWRVDPEALRRLLPAGVEPDLGFGGPWVGIVAFVMSRTRSILPPYVPVLASIPELNVRTYVTVDGEPGVWFLTLDASSPLFVNGGRVLYGLNYRRARMVVVSDGDTIHYSSAAGKAAFAACYRPTGVASPPARGSTAHFLVERYRFFAVRHGALVTAEVEHEPWELQDTAAEILLNRMAPGNLSLDGDPLLHYSAGVRARISSPERLRLGLRGNLGRNRLKETHEHHHDPDHRPARPADPRLLRPRADGSLTQRDAETTYVKR